MHKDGVLVMALSAHVDDLKITGEMPVIRAFLKHMGQHFGELTEKWHEFEHCGIMHTQNKERFLGHHTPEALYRQAEWDR